MYLCNNKEKEVINFWDWVDMEMWEKRERGIGKTIF